MKISIVIPCYNVAGTLEKSVNCIHESGLTDYEILLIDDGSKDRTPEICDSLSSSDQRIRVMHQSNNGVSSARNRGVEVAKGEYIWFFDADDSVDPGSMIHPAQIIEKKRPDMLMFGMSFDYYCGVRLYQRLELYYDQERYLTRNDQLDTVFSDLYHNNMLTPCWNKLFKREILLNHGIQFHCDMFVLEDFLFSLEALSKCNTIYILPKVIYRYNQGNSPANKHAEERVNRISDLEKYLQHFEKALLDHTEIMTSVFYMLLKQKLSVQTIEEMRETAKMVCESKFTKEPYEKYCSDADKELIHKLREGEYKKVYLQYRKARIRRNLVSRIKTTRLYGLIKGSSTKRVIW